MGLELLMSDGLSINQPQLGPKITPNPPLLFDILLGKNTTSGHYFRPP